MTNDELRECGATFNEFYFRQPRSYQEWIAAAPSLEALAPIVKEVLGLQNLPTYELLVAIEEYAQDEAISRIPLESRVGASNVGTYCAVQHRTIA